MHIRPYLIVPKLIPQPTWGGEYIARYKNISDPKIASMKIGQSYELSADTMLSTVTDSEHLPLEIGDPKTGKTIEVIGDQATMFSLKDLIDQDSEAVLGKPYVDMFGARMEILIKFTQAKGNSFQVHVRPGKEIGHWKPKPESWYFLEKGKATLGLKDPTPESIAAYKKTCEEILGVMEQLSADVRAGRKTPGQAKVDAAASIASNSPFRYVNTLDIPREAIIDLSFGGIHHSWEEGESIPDGNIVYEVQLNVMDNECTLRSFDKGKIGDDGSLRPIHIEDYFSALDADPAKNDPHVLIRQKSGVEIFRTPYYSTTQDEKEGTLDTFFGDRQQSFVHCFINSREVVRSGLRCGRGSSLFFPALWK